MAAAPYASAEKRAELVSAASTLFHEQGLTRTTLAHVAQRAQVSLGNLYYYFKTKEALAEVVISEHERILRSHFDALTQAHGDPRIRLKLFVRAPLSAPERVVRFGCSHTSLCQEVEKLEPGSVLPTAAKQLLSAYLEWTAAQFEAYGFEQMEAAALGADLVGAVKGALLLANTMQSEELLKQQLARIERWLDRVCG